jgi:O-antigen ligase
MINLIILTFILAPAYVLRFNLLKFPTDVLMVWVILVWIIFWAYLVKNKLLSDYFKFKQSINKKLLVFIGLFFLAGVISLFVKGFDRAKLGQFIVLFFQPISIFFIGGYIFQKFPKSKPYLLLTTYCLLALAGLYAVLQYFTLIGLPQAWWGNSVEPKRALSFFVHPNFYALWAAPLLALLIPDVAQNLKSKILNLKSILWLLGAIGLLFSFSRAGWLGLTAAILIYLIVAADKKIRQLVLYAFIVIVIVTVSIPNLRFRFILPFYGEKSAVSRLSLWETGIKGIKESPITGLGLTGFSRNWERLNTDLGLPDTHNFPHNIFLDFWVETGLLGLVSFIGIAWFGIYNGFKNLQDIIKLGVALFLITMIVQGLIDNPYFKNDLAMVFWVILAMII